MTALEQADQLTQQAVEILLAARQEIEQRPTKLGYGEIKTASQKKRGRPCKEAISPVVLPCSSEQVLS